MLSQKINSFKLTKPEEPTRRCDRIDNLCDQIESDLEAYTQRFSERVFDSRHLVPSSSCSFLRSPRNFRLTTPRQIPLSASKSKTRTQSCSSSFSSIQNKGRPRMKKW